MSREPEASQEEPVFSAIEVTKDFGRGAQFLRRNSGKILALDRVNFEVRRGESLGLVGESGSGKTTLARMLAGFDAPTAGTVQFRGRPMTDLRRHEHRAFVREVQMVFQNPFASLNPFRTVRDSLSAGYRANGQRNRAAIEENLAALLDRVGLHRSMLDRYPHEFSGGQRQRIVLARALTVKPSVLIADEPVSALDVSIQAQVLNLLNDLRDDPDLGLTVVMVTHDLAVARFFCDRISVMYAGRIVETGPTDDIIERSHHPYTRMLLSAAPSPDPRKVTQRPWVRSELSVVEPPRDGCVFAPRCWLRERLDNPPECETQRPADNPVGEAHLTACHFGADVPTAANAEMAPAGAVDA